MLVNTWLKNIYCACKHGWSQHSQPETMEGCSNDDSDEVTIFKVLGVYLCAQAILDLVPVKDLVRSQRVCRRWQGVVHHYLRGCRTLSFDYVAVEDWRLSYAHKASTHRRIDISPKDHPLLLACKVVKKWAPSIVKLNAYQDWSWMGAPWDSACPSAKADPLYINKQYKDFLNVITSKCLYLQEIKIIIFDEQYLNSITNLKNLRLVSLQYFDENKNTDELLGNIFQKLCCESILIERNFHLTGSFLNSINSNNLKCLCLTRCSSLNIGNMLAAVHCLRNITTLHLDTNTSVIRNVHLLLKGTPKLEELALRRYTIRSERFEHIPDPDDVWFESFGELVNLRRLYMENYVNDTLLKALARGCKKLECLDACGSAEKISVSGLAALCRRSPTARTTLHFGVPGYFPDADTSYFISGLFRYIEDIDLFKDLEALGCVEMTPEWFSAAARDPRGRELLLNPNAVQAQAPDAQELKIIIFKDY